MGEKIENLGFGHGQSRFEWNPDPTTNDEKKRKADG
jgi:hypothetical protein